MTLEEFKSEFRTSYDMSSYGAPSLNNYEISYFLTQAVRDIVEDLYSGFEFSEYNKRALGPLIYERELILTDTQDYFENTYVKEAKLPVDLDFILQENVKLNGVNGLVEVISEDLDNMNKSMKNPFKRPTDARVLRNQISKDYVRLFSSKIIELYKIKYLKRYSPIIVSDFDTDPDLLGSETLDGKNKKTSTELPTFLHHKIVKRAVQLAIVALRENNLKTNIEV